MTAAIERAVLGQRWERAIEWPLMIAALIFLAAYAVPILNPAGHRETLRDGARSARGV
jgi:hypothetical protein